MLRKVVADYGPGCVMLARNRGGKMLDLIGTAFICHAKGYLFTAAHTFSLGDDLGFLPPAEINKFNPSELTKDIVFIPLEVAQFDAPNDVALLKIKNFVQGMVPPDIFGDADLTPVGASLGYLGFPHAHNGQHALKVSSAILSSKVVSPSSTRQLVLDSMAEACNSGGPLIDVASNKIIGIISRRFSPSGNTVFAKIGNHALGTESMISYATAIDHALALLAAEGLNV